MASIDKETHAMHREVKQFAQVSLSLANGDDIRWLHFIVAMTRRRWLPSLRFSAPTS